MPDIPLSFARAEPSVAPPMMLWNDYMLSNPIEDIEAFRRVVQSAIGYTPDTWDSSETIRKRWYAFLDAAEERKF